MIYRQIILVFTFMITSFAGWSQGDFSPQRATMNTYAKAMGYSFTKGDYKNFASFIHPIVVELMGGREAMIETFNTDKEIRNNLISIDFGTPGNVVKVDKELQCTIPQILKMKSGAKKIMITTTLIGVSYDNGKRWYFVDARNNTGKSDDLKKILPNLSPKLVIVPQKTTEFK